MHKILVHAQDSLCMHNTLVHAQHSCACTGGARDQGWDPNKKRRGSGPGAAFFCWVPALVPGPCSACTRVLCKHKNLVHAQEPYIIISYYYIIIFSYYIIILYFIWLYHIAYYIILLLYYYLVILLYYYIILYY